MAGCLGAIAFIVILLAIFGSLGGGGSKTPTPAALAQLGSTPALTPEAAATPKPAPAPTPEANIHELWAKEDWEGIIRALERKADLSPENKSALYGAYVNRATQLLEANRPGQARHMVWAALALFPDRKDAEPLLARADRAMAREGAMLELRPGWACRKEYGFIRTEGQVSNISNQSLRNVTAVATYAARDGSFVTSAEALIAYNPILPGQISPFTAITTDNPAIARCGIDFKFVLGGKIPHYEAPR